MTYEELQEMYRTSLKEISELLDSINSMHPDMEPLMKLKKKVDILLKNTYSTESTKKLRELYNNTDNFNSLNTDETINSNIDVKNSPLSFYFK